MKQSGQNPIEVKCAGKRGETQISFGTNSAEMTIFLRFSFAGFKTANGVPLSLMMQCMWFIWNQWALSFGKILP